MRNYRWLVSRDLWYLLSYCFCCNIWVFILRYLTVFRHLSLLSHYYTLSKKGKKRYSNFVYYLSNYMSQLWERLMSKYMIWKVSESVWYLRKKAYYQNIYLSLYLTFEKMFNFTMIESLCIPQALNICCFFLISI